jgi:hypothetical protein
MTGYDVIIDRLLTIFNRYLWTDETLKSFNGLANRNLRDDKIIAEIFKGGKEYKEVMFDDRLNALCFFDFDGDEKVIDGSLIERDVNIIFAVNLKALYPDITTYRAIEESHREVLNVMLTDGTIDVEVTAITSGLNAYGSLSTDRLKNYSMQPYHTFSINATMKYYLTC